MIINSRFIQHTIYAALLFALSVINCKEATNKIDTDSRLIVQLHDEPFLKSGKVISEINITVERVDIIHSSSGEIITLMETPSSMNILDITENDPVILSDTSVEAGMYDQLRLVLSENNTIVVDGVSQPITIPSGQQTGVKITGPFELQPGKLFRINLDFIAAQSVIYNKGQGYKLKPVIKVTSTGSVIGNFRGNLALFNAESTDEMIVQLYDDNTFRMRVSDYSAYTIRGPYFHDTVTQKITFVIESLSNNNSSDLVLGLILGMLPDTIVLDVLQWSLSEVVVVDIAGDVNSLYRTDSFSFSANITYTDLEVIVEYPNKTKDGKSVVIQITPIQGGGAPLSKIRTMENGSITELFKIPNTAIPSSNTAFEIVAYLFDDVNNINMDGAMYGGELTVLLSGSKIAETSNNPWQPVTYNIEKNGINSHTIRFPTRMNIRYEGFDYSHNKPTIFWDPYPGAQKYFVVVLVPDKTPGGDDNENNDQWDIAFSQVTTETNALVLSDKLRFVAVEATGGAAVSDTLQPGDLVRTEVYALDGSPQLDMASKTGALFMDSYTIVLQ